MSQPQPNEPRRITRADAVFGICDRLIAHDRAIVSVVVVPAKEDGSPNWDRVDPTNLESLPDDEWPEDEQVAKRVAVLVDQIDGCDPETSVLVYLDGGSEIEMVQIAGPDADSDVANRIIGRDIGAKPPERNPGPVAESFAKLTAELTAANDNTPPDGALVSYLEAYAGPESIIMGDAIYGAIVDGMRGQIRMTAGGRAMFIGKNSSKLISLPAKPRDRFTVEWFGDIEEDLPKEEILKGVFGVNEYTLLSGKPGSGKSVITTDIACHVAAGMEWHGRAVKQGLVVYIAAERKALTKRRMLAFRKRHGVGNIPLIVLGGMMDLTSSLKDADAIAETIKQAEQDCGLPCVWIIVDTLTRTFGPGDQNASKDMTKFVQACDALREAVTDTHLTVIHHTGWAGDRGKGAIDLDGAVDASFLVKKEAGGYVLECDGANDGDEGVITHFRMESVQVGEKDGEPTMAPVVVPHDGKSLADGMLAKIEGHTAKALEVLRSLTEGEQTVPSGLWRSAFYAEYPDVETNTLKTRFRRAKERLVGDSLVIESAEGYAIVDPGT